MTAKYLTLIIATYRDERILLYDPRTVSLCHYPHHHISCVLKLILPKHDPLLRTGAQAVRYQIHKTQRSLGLARCSVRTYSKFSCTLRSY
jgi:hypothetical protein